VHVDNRDAITEKVDEPGLNPWSCSLLLFGVAMTTCPRAVANDEISAE